MRERWMIAGVTVLLLVLGAFVGYTTYRDWTARHWLTQGDEAYRGGHYHAALAAYYQGHTVKPTSHARERIQLATTTLFSQTQGSAAREPERSRISAAKIRVALAAGEFAEVQRLMQGWLAAKTVTPSGYLHAASVLSRSVIQSDTWANKANLLPQLEAWVKHDQASSLAWTFRGAFHYGAAWKVRGSGFASTVSEQSRAVFEQRLALAAIDLQAAARLDAGNPLPPLYLLAAARAQGADLKTMEGYFQLAMRYDPFLYEAHSQKYEYLTPKWYGSEDAMFDFARATLRRAPSGSALPALLAEAHLEKGCNIVHNCSAYYREPAVWAEVQAVFQRLMEDFPDSGLWPSTYAKAAQVAGRLEEARLYHDLAVRRDSEDFEVRFERARFWADYLGDYQRAAGEYAEALRLEPQSLKALTHHASSLYRGSQWAKAMPVYSQILTMNPEDPKIYFMRASARFMQQQYREAVEDYSQAITLKPDYRLAYEWRAKCYERMGIPEKQQADLRTLDALPKPAE